MLLGLSEFRRGEPYTAFHDFLLLPIRYFDEGDPVYASKYTPAMFLKVPYICLLAAFVHAFVCVVLRHRRVLWRGSNHL